MARRQVTKFRRLRAVGEDPPWRRHVQGKGGAFLILLGWVALAIAFYYTPQVWTAYQGNAIQQKFNDLHWNDIDGVERAWKSLPLLPAFQKGDEPEVRTFLDSQPLVVAVFDRFGQRQLWQRDGDHLRPANPAEKQAQTYLNWLAHAEAAQRFDWNPPKDQDPGYGKVSTIVLLADRWLVIKRWEPGSPQVEEFLRRTLRPNAGIRVGLIRQQDLDHADSLENQDWGREPHFQADPGRLANYAPMQAMLQTNAFGEGWNIGYITATAAEVNTVVDRLMKQVWIIRFVSALILLSVLAGFWLRSRARQRAMLDADRMASLTHSLKTPLAILKFRCDTLRLGRLDQDHADAELMKLSSEVDQLTLMIENGLRAIRGDAATGPTEDIDSGWIRGVVEDLRPGYEMDGRPLDLRLGPERGKAAPASLRSAVLTLVENALLHGRGRVVVETGHQGRRMAIRVRDEGPGLDPAELAALGKPYQRFREIGKEGFLHEGQGLGLSLLFQVAEREGWGLSLESAPGEGFSAQLDIQRA
ncbi:MAG TPA: HAMP domain-containing sensor histidine kinase [Holophagaceae bacterium]|nr:HAMP domain-containing sensor histidine kinase [Holophagaceae bacterium]